MLLIDSIFLTCEWSIVLIWVIDTSHTLLLGKLDTFSDMSHLDNAKASFGSMSNPLQFWWVVLNCLCALQNPFNNGNITKQEE